jgi:hydrogenase maturation factor HypF (carbamoyltransferase family)
MLVNLNCHLSSSDVSIDRVRKYCQVNPLAAQLLQSANAPIVLLPVRDSRSVMPRARLRQRVGEALPLAKASACAERLRQRPLVTLPDEIIHISIIYC